MRNSARRHRRSLAAVITIGALSVSLVACGNQGPKSGPEEGPFITSNIRDGQTGVGVLAPIMVAADAGELQSVKLINQESGDKVKAEKDGLQWKSTEPLGYGQTYTLSATAWKMTKKHGKQRTVISRTFTTLVPENQTMPYIYPLNEAVVGVAQPVAIKFDEPIDDRVAAERCIHIKTEPAVEGAFFWISNSEVRWRGEHFWKPGTKITVNVKCYGQELGDGLYVQGDQKSSFTIGDRVVGYADDNTHRLVIKKNGKTIKSMPISMGSDKHPTPHGIYYVAEQKKEMWMDSSTFGVPTNSADGYRTKVQWATRISYSGIFIHGAPWSIYQQGRSNASHGCLNVSPVNGEWAYHNLKTGDPIIVVHTKGPKLSGTDGLGDWNIPWSEWQAGNADEHY